MKTNMTHILTGVALLSASAFAQAGKIQISSSFSPSTVEAGQSTTFIWSSSSNAMFCEVMGLPSGATYGRSGSETFTATSSLTATVLCENANDAEGATRKSTLTVEDNTPPPPVVYPPIISASFSPAVIAIGQSSTLSWSAMNATSCWGNSADYSVSGTSGSDAAQPSSSQSITISCSGEGGTTTKNVSVSVQTATKPSVSMWSNFPVKSPFRSGYDVTVYISASNANSCNLEYIPVGTFGSHTFYTDYSRSYFGNCTGPGGTTYASVFVSVPFTGNMLSRHADEQLSVKRDFNNDGFEDTFAINKATKQGTLWLGTGVEGEAKKIKQIDGISDMKQLKEIFIIGENATINIEQ